MKESLLNKTFQDSDVLRMRNIITKKYNDPTKTQVGYKKSLVPKVEDDIWEENGKVWTITNGIKVNVTKLDELKKIMQLPLTCPKCSKPMNKGNVDKKMYFIHKMCFDCVIEYEAKLKLEGKFEEYQKAIINEGINSHIRELENLVMELYLNESNDSFITEQGDIEKWQGKGLDNTKLIEDIKEYIEKLKSSL